MEIIKQKETEDIINEAYSRANSIDAVRGLAYRSGNIRESKELDRARTMIFKLIDHLANSGSKREEDKE